jgi:multidrug efflux pump subunit AcrA (membrane-fusion protein)
LAIMLYLIFDAMRKGRIFEVAYNQRGAILKPGRLITLGIILVALVALALFVRLPLRIANDCVVVPLEQVSLKTSTPGAAELLIERANEEKVLKQYQLVGQDYSVLSIVPALKVGDSIKPGGLIASIKSNVYESEKLERYANLARSKKQLDLLEKGPQPEEIKQTEDMISQAKTKFDKSNQDLNRAESLYAKGGISQKELEDTRTNNQVLKSELDFYKNQLVLLKRGARPEELDMAKAQVDQLEARLKHLESQLEQTVIESPIEGTVTQVNNGSMVISIARTDTVKAKISVPEKEISEVSVGDEVKMKARSYPGLTYSGVVVKIDPIAIENDRGQSMIAVTALVDNPEGLLKSGMTGKAKINCGSRPLYKIILWRAVRYLRVEFWSWW